MNTSRIALYKGLAVFIHTVSCKLYQFATLKKSLQDTKIKPYMEWIALHYLFQKNYQAKRKGNF